jgi:hypothetical protein
MVAATLAGRATARVPIRFLIAPGLVLVGVGLYLMSQLGPHDSWTQLIPGFIVAGVGAGLVNPPLASTAVGVVEPARSGMASGINSTFRQVGIATGTAALGSILGSAVASRLATDLRAHPLPGVHASTLATAVSGGGSSAAVQHAPPAARAQLTAVISDSFVHSLDEVLLIGAVVAVVSGLLTLVLVRAKDFAAGSQRHQPQGTAPDEPEPAREPALVGAPPRRDQATGGRPEANTAPTPAAGGTAVSGNGHAPRPERGADGAGGSGSPSAEPVAARPRPPETALVPAPGDGHGPGHEDVRPGEPAEDGSTTRELSVSLTFRLRRPGRRR